MFLVEHAGAERSLLLPAQDRRSSRISGQTKRDFAPAHVHWTQTRCLVLDPPGAVCELTQRTAGGDKGMARGAVWRDPRVQSSIAGLRRCRCLTDPLPTHPLGQQGLVMVHLLDDTLNVGSQNRDASLLGLHRQETGYEPRGLQGQPGRRRGQRVEPQPFFAEASWNVPHGFRLA